MASLFSRYLHSRTQNHHIRFFTKFSAESDLNLFTNFPIYILSEVDFTLDLEDAVVVQNLFLLSKSSDISKD